MGRSPRDKPRELGDKLKKIRVDLLNLSQTEMAKALALTISYAGYLITSSERENHPC
jgi:plasmid maintenance system antidote protein VapI